MNGVGGSKPGALGIGVGMCGCSGASRGDSLLGSLGIGVCGGVSGSSSAGGAVGPDRSTTSGEHTAGSFKGGSDPEIVVLSVQIVCKFSISGPSGCKLKSMSVTKSVVEKIYFVPF